MLLPIIVGISIFAFLFVVLVIYFDNIKSFLKKKFHKEQKKSKDKDEGPKKEAQKMTVEDFKPMQTYERDPLLDKLLSKKDEISFDNPLYEEPKNKNDYDIDESVFRRYLNENHLERNESKSIAEQINELSPELKILLIDNLLKRKDDI